MSIAAVAAPALSAPPAASELRAGASAAATFLQVLEEEMLHEAVPASLPPPTFPLPLPGSLPPEYPWMPMPLFVLPREDRTARKRPQARGDKKPGRR